MRRGVEIFDEKGKEALKKRGRVKGSKSPAHWKRGR